MPINNIPTATGIASQYGPGQILVIPPNPHFPQGVTYFVPRIPIDNSSSLQPSPQGTPTRVIPQATIQPQHQSPPTIVDRIEKPKDLDKTNAKIRNIKEKCISHFIEGQLILETTKPLNELKTKSVRKKDKKKHLNQHAKLEKQSQNLNQSNITSESVEIDQRPQTSQNSSGQLVATSIKQETPGLDSNDDIQQIRAEMPSWSVADVVLFIEKHDDIKQYSSKFADDEVDGKALMLMIDRNLNVQMLASMFKHGPAMKIEAVLSKYKSIE